MEQLRSAHARSAVLAAVVAATLRAGVAPAAELPVPCATGTCGAGGPASWVTSGLATFVQSGNELTVTQGSSSATLNWRSFNVSPDGRVVFRQPDAAATALNRIYQEDPARIFGRLEANGRVFLLNQNGILFGPSARVNVGGLLATTLDLTPEALNAGLAGAIARGFPALDGYANGLPSGAVLIDAGARIETSSGGQVLVFAPEVTNRGEIRTPDGQIVLGAGQRVFLLANTTLDLRGLLVEVGAGGTVTNGDAAAPPGTNVGELVAERGNVTIAALAVNQLGRISATTSVRANGSIRLQARDTSRTSGLVGELDFDRTGEMTLGARSVTAVELDGTDGSTSVDANEQPRSSVQAYGRSVVIGAGALVRAKAGTIDLEAIADTFSAIDDGVGVPNDSRIVIERGATLDVSGARTSLPVERNSLRVELRGSQLADFPLQRDGALRGEAVYVDARRYGVRADGTPWVGSPIGSLQGDLSTIARGLAERNLAGGTIDLRSQGAVMVADGATLDVAGGAIDWQGGYVRTSRLLGADGRTYDIANADPNRPYVGIVGEQVLTDTRWGLQGSFNLLGDPRGTFEAGYVEGKDAGRVVLVAPRVALDGRVDGTTVAGRYQRLPRTGGFAGFYRPYDERPAGASLVVGFDQESGDGAQVNLVTSAITLGLGGSLASYRNADGTPFDPRRDPLPTAFDRVFLRPDLFGSGGIASAQLYANGEVLVPQGTRLSLAPGESFTVEAGRVRVLGGVTSPGGQVSLAARRTFVTDGLTPETKPAIVVGGDARLDVAGLWTNDDPLQGKSRIVGSPLFPDAGAVTLAADDGSVTLAPGSVIDASGGAVRRADGRLVDGRAGAITLVARPRSLFDPVTVVPGGALLGHALSRGGSLAVTVSAACVSAAPCRESGATRFAPEFFSTGGFASTALSTNRGDLVVAADADVRARQWNFVLRDDSRFAPSGTPLRSLADIVLLPDDVRRPSAVALAANLATFDPAVTDFADSTAFADLVVEPGAAIATDPRGSISLASNSRLLFGGALSAPGGTVSLTLTSTLAGAAFYPQQAMWLTSTARIDVSGRTLLDPNRPEGVRAGQVLDGGRITLDARRGYVIAQQGARLDLSGAVDRLDVRQADGLLVPTSLVSAGGTLSILTTEGLLFDATVAARGGTSNAAGGTLVVGIDTRRNNDQQGTLPSTTRSIELSTADAPTVVAAGAPVPGAFNGRALVPASMIGNAGFDDVTLRALTALNVATQELAPGRISIAPDVDLATRGRLVLEAPEIALAGTGTARLGSAYLALGPSDRANAVSVTPAPGAGALDLSGRLVELVGDVAFSGLDSTRIAAVDALRLRGVSPFGIDGYFGRAAFAGELTVAAGTTLGTTLSTYALDAARSLAWTTPGAAPAAPVLSAGATLRFSAPTIEVDGAIVAPLGTLDFVADSFRLGANGSLDASATTTVPFGRVEAGRDWVYEFENDFARVYAPTATPLPSGSVTIRASNVRTDPGSRIDVAGAGDLLAFEFLPGPTGNVDLLDAATRPQQFAILPGNRSAFASFDPREYRASPLRPGDSIVIAAGSDLPPGEYALYPARYALLPGARLVTAVPALNGLPPGESRSLFDGSVVVAGYRTLAGAGVSTGAPAAFAIAPETAVAGLARYERYGANRFFAADASTAFRTPRDAGVLAFDAARSLAVRGAVDLRSAPGGAAGFVDIAATRVRVAADATGPSDPAVVRIVDEDLRNLAAGSILIGGRRAIADGRVELRATSSEVEVESGASIEGGEIVLVASDRVRLRSGASLAATGGGTDPSGRLRVDGAAALLVASGRPLPDFERSGSTTGSSVADLEAGARVSASGSILIAATGSSSLGGTLATPGGLGFDLPRLTIAADGGTGRDRIGAAQLAASGATALRVGATEAVTLAGSYTLALQDVALRSATLVAASADTSVGIVAARVALAGATTATASGAALGRLELRADAVELSGGALTVDVGDLTIASRTPVRIVGDGRLLAARNANFGGGLQIGAPGVDFTIDAGTRLAVTGGTGDTAAANAALGGALRLTAPDVAVDGLLEAPAGRLEVSASGTGPLGLGPDARLSVAAPRIVIDDVALPVAGGAIVLRSARGDVVVAGGARLDARAQGPAAGGSLHFEAPAGAVRVAGTLAAGGASGGRFSVDASAFDLSTLAAAATQAGATGEFSARLRGPGDLALAAGTTLRAGVARLVAEQGAITIGGTLDARSPGGGRVALYAAGPVEVRGRVDLTSTVAAPDAAPRLEIGSGSAVRLDPASRLDFGTTPGAELWLRLPRESLAPGGVSALGSAVRLGGTVVGAPRLTLEGFRVYTLARGSIGAADVGTGSAWFADSAAFATAVGGDPAAALGTTLATRVVPGIELRRTDGPLALDADWNLQPWRFGGHAPVLTIRSSGDLTFNRSLSDGFAAVTGAAAFTLPETPGESASYRLVAGADLASVAPLTVLARDAATLANLAIARGTPRATATAPPVYRMIRTGTGTIDLAASGDLRFGNQASVVYTAGTSGAGVRLPGAPNAVANAGLANLAYPENGGDISITVGGDVVGPASRQLYSEWLWRSGARAGEPRERVTGYTVNFAFFEQGVATLGGGDLRVSAGGSIRDLGASVVAIGRQVGGLAIADNRVEETGGGRLSVRAAGDITGGTFFVGRGTGSIAAGGSIGARQDGDPGSLAPTLAVGDSRLAVEARRDLAIETTLNPTLVRKSTKLGTQAPSNFATYAPGAGVGLIAAGGELRLGTGTEVDSPFSAFFRDTQNVTGDVAAIVAPPTVEAFAASGDLRIAGSLTLWPAARGNLTLIAAENLRFDPLATRLELILSDADVEGTLATPARPTGIVPSGEAPPLGNVLATNFLPNPAFYARVPVHSAAASPDGRADPTPVRLVAARGDVDFLPNSAPNVPAGIFSAKRVRVVAGRDVRSLALLAQHVAPGDVSSIVAGRDVIYPLARDARGAIGQSTRSIGFGGPGNARIVAGRDIDLQTSAGITSEGAVRNPAFTGIDGANVSLIAGLAGGAPDYDGFARRYLADATTHRALLRDYVAGVTGVVPSDDAQALRRFGELSLDQRAVLLEQILFAELRAGGRSAAAPGPGSGDFTRAFEALEALLPGSNPDLDGGEENPYVGDVRLVFSRVYTLGGGDVSLLAPGGAIDVGLASPPLSFGIDKSASQLGIVAQGRGSVSSASFGDFQVNESRVFAGDGGDILVWSTRGDIDAGRGAKTAISAPPPTVTIDEQGRLSVTFPNAFTGSGIQTLASTPGREPGDVDLYAPRGVVNAGDAGIVAGNLTIAATAVLGAGNITVSGTAVGVPVDTGGLGAALAGVSASSSAATSSGTTDLAGAQQDSADETPLSDGAVRFLEVFVIGLGEEQCRPDDLECLRRQR